MPVLLESKVCAISGAGGSIGGIGGAITRGYARGGARAILAGRIHSKRDQVADEWLRPALSNVKVAVRLVHGCTGREGTYARSCV